MHQRVAGAVVARVLDAVEGRVPHHEVGRGHVDFGAQHACPVRELARPHTREEVEILRDRAVPVGAVAAGIGEGAAVFADLVRAEVVDVGLAEPDELHGELVEPLEVVRREEPPLAPVEPHPAHVFLDGGHVFHGLLGRVGVVEAQVGDAAEGGRQAEVEADGLGVADVQVAVRLRREARGHAAAVLAGGHVGFDDLPDEIGRGGCCRGFLFRRHGPLLSRSRLRRTGSALHPRMVYCTGLSESKITCATGAWMFGRRPQDNRTRLRSLRLRPRAEEPAGP